jgi:hypothetical protein
MKLRSIAVLVLGALLAFSMPVSADDDFDALLPDEIAGVEMFRAPAEFEALVAAGLLESGDISVILSLYGVDKADAGASMNFDGQRFLDAQEDGSVTQEDKDALALWEADMLMVIALRLGAEIAMDELLTAMVAMTPEEAGLTDFTVAGQRIISGMEPVGDDSWGAIFGVNDVLYLALSHDTDPSVLETVASILRQE